MVLYRFYHIGCMNIDGADLVYNCKSAKFTHVAVHRFIIIIIIFDHFSKKAVVSRANRRTFS